MVLGWSVPIRGRKLPTGRPSKRSGVQHTRLWGWAVSRLRTNEGGVVGRGAGDPEKRCDAGPSADVLEGEGRPH